MSCLTHRDTLSRGLYVTVSTQQAWADDKSKISQNCKNYQHFAIWWVYLDSPWEMHSNKYKHAWYWFRNLLDLKNFEKQNNFVWMVKTMAACKVLKQDRFARFTWTYKRGQWHSVKWVTHSWKRNPYELDCFC